jgi:hypothetical protein
MDGSRFDAFTRRWGAVRGSRRAALRSLVGVGLGALLAGPGWSTRARKRRRKRCRKNGQTCVSFGQTLGPCCKNSSCQEVPQDQRKFCLCKPGFWDPNRTGFCVPVTCGSLGDACASVEECCPRAIGTGLACARIGNEKGPRGCGFLTQPDPPSRCCIGEAGTICTGDCDCCGDLTCQNGHCLPSRPVCLAVGETCDEDAQCCGGNTTRTRCSRIDSGKANGRCGGPAALRNRCCTAEDWECEDTCDCCGSMRCINGSCRYTLLGASCEDSSECVRGTCQVVLPKPDGSCLIPANLPPPQLCCLAEGEQCFGTSCDCCGALTCQDSVCSSFGSG